MPNENKNIFKHEINFEIKETSTDDEFFYFEGYGSTSDLDLTNDIVESGAFRKSLKKKIPVMLWQHRSDEPIGVYESLQIKKEGLKVRGKMPLEDTFVSGRVIPQLKIKSVQALSIGFRVKKDEYDRNTGIRVIKEVDLHEISLVTFPANPQAIITALKSFLDLKEEKKDCLRDEYLHPFAPLDYQWDEKEAFDRVGEGGSFLDIEGKYFPILDIVDGKTLTVPRAIFSARAILSGAKSHSIEDIEGTKETIDAYYKRMDMEPPFNGGKGRPFCLTEIKNVSKSILSGILRNCNISKDAADYAAGKLMSHGVGSDTNDLDELNKSLDSLRKTFKNKE